MPKTFVKVQKLLAIASEPEQEKFEKYLTVGHIYQ